MRYAGLQENGHLADSRGGHCGLVVFRAETDRAR
jgi:hypothetical protein